MVMLYFMYLQRLYIYRSMESFTTTTDGFSRTEYRVKYIYVDLYAENSVTLSITIIILHIYPS